VIAGHYPNASLLSETHKVIGGKTMAITRPRTLKQYAYENIQIGEEFGPVEGILSE
jgi:hypothetical protein